MSARAARPAVEPVTRRDASRPGTADLSLLALATRGHRVAARNPQPVPTPAGVLVAGVKNPLTRRSA